MEQLSRFDEETLNSRDVLQVFGPTTRDSRGWESSLLSHLRTDQEQIPLSQSSYQRHFPHAIYALPSYINGIEGRR